MVSDLFTQLQHREISAENKSKNKNMLKVVVELLGRREVFINPYESLISCGYKDRDIFPVRRSLLE